MMDLTHCAPALNHRAKCTARQIPIYRMDNGAFAIPDEWPGR